MENTLIDLRGCDIASSRQTFMENISWQMAAGECWLVIGKNDSAKAHFLDALAGSNGLFVQPSALRQDARYFSAFGRSVEIVSLERAAKLIEEERQNDESDYVEGGVDIGRSGRVFIAEAVTGRLGQNMPTAALPTPARQLEAHEAVLLCGVEKILDRGLKYMSTGEVRRTLLARALVGQRRLLILSNPFAGLDVESRRILRNFFSAAAERQVSARGNLPAAGQETPCLILAADRYAEIPSAITHVLEFAKNEISFCGSRQDYEALLASRRAHGQSDRLLEREQLAEKLLELSGERKIIGGKGEGSPANDSSVESGKLGQPEILIEMNDVNVGWGENRVLVGLTWALRQGEHWLIRGPNGSGKTTFLELITGDNMQVFANDVRLFGQRRGTGETIWDIKRRLGIVSYRLHVEYRMVGGVTLQNVIVSGFYDSIGLYEKPGDTEIAAARKWLALGGFGGRENELFSNLSYGEQRAVLILRAAVKNPPVLILDEPCHGLDDTFRQRILDLLQTVAEQGGTTLLHVTHEADEVLPCEQHVLEFLPGQSPMYRTTACSLPASRT